MLARLGLEALADHDVQTLSGGERQRVALATALLQGAPLLLLDEPASHLDLAHQRLLVDVLLAPRRGRRRGVASLHDLDLAWDLASHVVLLDGRAASSPGPRDAVLAADRLGAVFGVDIQAIDVRWRAPLRGRRRMRASERRSADDATPARCVIGHGRSRRRAGAARVALRALVRGGVALAARRASRSPSSTMPATRSTFARPPQRVVTLAPSLTELVFAAGAGASLVGASALSDYPPAARQRAARRRRRAARRRARARAAAPTSSSSGSAAARAASSTQLEAAGVRLFQLEPRRLDDVAARDRAARRAARPRGARRTRRAGALRARLERCAARTRQPRR